MRIIPTRTLADAQRWVEKHRHQGCICPACGQKVKVYVRKFNAGMARSMIYMYRIGGRDWVHTDEMPKICREEDKLAWWDLVEVKPRSERKRKDGGRTKGVWRLTEQGEQFVLREISIPKYAYELGGKLLHLSEDETITIGEAIGEVFSYDELMYSNVRALRRSS